MKVLIKTLKGQQFHIEVQPTDKVVTVKKQIERLQGPQYFPSEQQLLIYKGKVLNDETTLEENKVTHNISLVVTLLKSKAPTAGTHQTPPASGAQLPSSPPATTTHNVGTGITKADANAYNQEASTQPITAGTTGGANPNAVPLDLFPQGLSSLSTTGARPAATAQVGHNAGHSDILPQSLPNTMRSGSGALTNAQVLFEVIDILRSNPHFQALRPFVQANPEILQPMIERLSKKFPRVMEIIQDHQADILRLVTEPVQGAKDEAAGVMGEATTLSPEEREAIERLTAMGFEPARIIQVFLACDKNEEMTARYLRDHGDDDNRHTEL